MAGGVDDVEAMVVPEARRRSGLNRDAALLLLLHEVRRRGTVMHLTGLVDLTGELENALSGGGLACVHVREDANVAILAEVGHDDSVFVVCGYCALAAVLFRAGLSMGALQRNTWARKLEVGLSLQSN